MSISTAIPIGSVARVVGIEPEFVNLNAAGGVILPQRIAVFAEGSDAVTYSTDKAQIISSRQAGETYGFGSPIHLIASQLLPANGDGVGTIPVTIYPLDANGGATAAAGDITPSGAQTVVAGYRVAVNGILSEAFSIAVGATVAAIVTSMTEAINANVSMPVIATDSATQVDLAAKWKGATGNDITVEVIGDATAGTVFAVTQPVGGALYPPMTTALAQMGDVWETLAIQSAGIVDSATLNEIQTFGEGRWNPLTKKGIAFICGSTALDASTLTAITDARKTDFINICIPQPGSNNLPMQIAARAMARIAKVANENPPHDYARQTLTGIAPGTDGEQWDYAVRDAAVRAGTSTTQVKDGVPFLSDTVTFYHPTGEEPPAYRYLVDIVKLQNIVFNLNLIFESPEWDGAPLIPDDQATINPDAKRPKDAKAAVNSLLDFLGAQAIISDPATAKRNTLAEIDSSNPKRLNVQITVQLSGNVNIVSVDLLFGFYFGQA